MDRRFKCKLDNVRKEVVEAYTNGFTLRELAKIYSVSIGTIRNLLMSEGANLRKRGRKNKNGIRK